MRMKIGPEVILPETRKGCFAFLRRLASPLPNRQAARRLGRKSMKKILITGRVDRNPSRRTTITASK
jgi:hypothetical protein